MKKYLLCFLLLLCSSFLLQAQKAIDLSKRVLDNQAPIIMPYNRLVASAGKVRAYGDPRLENHTLDVALMPDQNLIAIEDRYGIAILNRKKKRIIYRWTFAGNPDFQGVMSTFSGVKAFEFQQKTYLVWGASQGGNGRSGIVITQWANDSITKPEFFPFPAKKPAPLSLPNEVEVQKDGNECYLYIVLNGNNQLVKMRLSDRSIVWTAATGVAPFGVKIANNKAYVSNWGGPIPSDPTLETAGVPWGAAYIDPRTGATLQGSVSVIDIPTGNALKEIQVGLHPNAMALSPNAQTLYVANGNSDIISVIDVNKDVISQEIPVGLFNTTTSWIGSSPNGLALDETGETLYVSNGLDNAVAVVKLGASPTIAGFIPTQAYPSGLLCLDKKLYVTNLEAIGARVRNKTPELKQSFPALREDDKDKEEDEDEAFEGAFNSHEQVASISIIKVPKPSKLAKYTNTVKSLNLTFRDQWSKQAPRPNVPPRPVPERIGEPSVFKHVVYIIKENRTYDQVYGDLPQGRGMKALCVFGDSVTPNQHKLALEYGLLDNYYVSGKSSAEGHQWTDAGIVSDYIEKSVRGWFRSYPHVQYDAMVYTKNGFIWNHALDHGKTVRIYGEACSIEMDRKLTWKDIYKSYVNKASFEFKNTSTISRVRPILSADYPCYDDHRVNDQLRADAFIADLQRYEQMPGDSLPNLMVLALPNDHTAGTAPGYPTPRAFVADNDLALGRIMEALTKSRFWDATVVFVTEDDSQNGWDHISAYRTGALVMSPYSRLGKTIPTNYNQISMLRTIEQILGLPPMHAVDATATPMFDCFTDTKASVPYHFLPNRIPLEEMNGGMTSLSGKALHYAQQSQQVMVGEGVDNGKDDLMNRILWFSAKGDTPYPKLKKSK